jgi:hypothetical protein
MLQHGIHRDFGSVSCGMPFCTPLRSKDASGRKLRLKPMHQSGEACQLSLVLDDQTGSV